MVIIQISVRGKEFILSSGLKTQVRPVAEVNLSGSMIPGSSINSQPLHE